MKRHFEVLVLRQTGWTLNSICSDRASAVGEATDLSRIEGFARVKVVDCRFDASAGTFEEYDVQLLTRDGGKIPPATRRPVTDAGSESASGEEAEPVSDEPVELAEIVPRVCRFADDLFGFDARRTMAQHLRKSLDTWMVTPSEVLHSWHHFVRLEQAGTVLQAAVQQVAIAHPMARSVGAPVLVKQIWKAIDDASKRLHVETAALDTADLAGDMPGLRRLGGATIADRHRLTMNAVAEHLRAETTWCAKLARLSRLLPIKFEAEDLAVVDSVIAEIIMLPTGRANLLSLLETGASFAGDAKLVQTDRPSIATIGDLFKLLEAGPTREAAAKAPPEVLRLLDLLHDARLHETNAEILLCVAQEVEGPRRLTAHVDGPDVLREAKAMAEITSRLASLQERFGTMVRRSPGSGISRARVPGIDAIAARIIRALEDRAEQLLRPELLGAQLGTITQLVPAVNLLIELSRLVVGDLNIRRIGKHLLVRLGGDLAAIRLSDVPDPEALANLKRVAAWQAEIRQADFEPQMRLQLSDLLDRLCLKLLDRLKVFHTIRRQRPNPVDQAIALFQLIGAQLITKGEAMALTRQRVLACVRDAGGGYRFTQQLNDRNVDRRIQASLSKFVLQAQQAASPSQGPNP